MKMYFKYVGCVDDDDVDQATSTGTGRSTNNCFHSNIAPNSHYFFILNGFSVIFFTSFPFFCINFSKFLIFPPRLKFALGPVHGNCSKVN